MIDTGAFSNHRDDGHGSVARTDARNIVGDDWWFSPVDICREFVREIRLFPITRDRWRILLKIFVFFFSKVFNHLIDGGEMMHEWLRDGATCFG